MSFLKSLVRSALAVLNTVEVNDSLHSLFGKSVVGVRTVNAVCLVVIIDVVVVEAVHKGERGLVSLSCGYELCTVNSKAECLTEGLVRENYRVGVTLGVVHLLEHFKVGVEEEGHCVCLVNLVELIGERVGGKLLSGRRPVRKLTLKECLLHSSLVHNVDNDLSGLVLLTLLAVNEEVCEGVEVTVLVGLPTVPVLVTNEYNLLALLERLHLVYAVRLGGFKGSTVSGGNELAGSILKRIVELAVNKPCACERCHEVVEADVGVVYVTDGVIINLVKTNNVPTSAECLVYNVNGNAGLVTLAVCEVSSVCAVNVSSGNPASVCGILILNSVSNAYPLRALVASLVLSACKAPEVVHVKVYSLTSCESCVDCVVLGVNGGVNALVLRVVVLVTTCYSGLTVVVEVSSVVLHRGVKKSLERLDVVISSDLLAILPSCLRVELDLENVTLGDISRGLAFGKIYRVLGKVCLVVLCYVGNRGSHFVNPLIYTVLGVENGHINEGRRNVAKHRVICVCIPCVGVPVGTKSSCSALVGVVLTVGYKVNLRIYSGVLAVISGLIIIVGSLIGGLVVINRICCTSSENANEHNESHQKRQNLDAFHFVNSSKIFFL